MRVLVLDTALGLCTAAVFEDGRAVTVRSEVMDKGHQERLGGLVQAVAGEAGGLDGVERIGVTVGPGSFTGLRVGLAFAQGLGTALGVPVVGISTLDALAVSAPAGVAVAAPIAALIDARRGQVYARLFGADGHPLSGPQALNLEDAHAAVVALGPAAVLIGSGAPLLDPEAESTPGPSPAALAFLTARLDPAEHPPRPLYLRAPDATPPTRKPGQARARPAANPA